MKRAFTYIGLIAGSFLIGFISFYYLMPVIVRHSKTVDVPYLTNMSVERSKSFISSLGLKCVVSDSILSSVVEKGKVIRTEPPWKKEVKIGSIIKLIVSKGPRKVKLPDIVGLPFEEALDSLDKYSITNRVIINTPVEEKEEDGKVIKTKPRIEDSLGVGGKLTIFIGKQEREVFLMPNLIGMKFQEAIEILADYKLVLAPVKWTKSANEEVILQSPLAGIEVTFGDTVRLVVSRISD